MSSETELNGRAREVRQLASATLALIKAEFSESGFIWRSVQATLRHTRKFWLALEVIFPLLGRIRRFCWGVATKYYYDDCFSYAAGLSFWLLISIIPLATLFFKLLVFFLGRQALLQQTIEMLRDVIPFIPVSFLMDTINHSREISDSMGLTWLVLLVGSYWGVNQLDTSLAHIFGVRTNKKLQTRSNHILRHIGLLVGGVFFLSLLLALLLGGTVKKYLPIHQSVILTFLPTIICLAATTMIFQVMPRLHVTFRQAFAGAVVTTCLWTAARWGFKIYVDNAFTWGIMYGSLLGIIAGLLFLYYTCAIVLLGAEVTAFLHRRRKL
jgi:membrane protein